MIAIAFALEFESACFRARHDPRLRVAVWLLGAMGEAAAVPLRRKMLEAKPALVISAGFAGGLVPQLKAGSLVIGKNYTDPRLLSQLALDGQWHLGDLHTASAIVEKAEDKRLLGVETGCFIADLETAHLAKICAEFGVPMLSVRCISDTVDEDMPVPSHTLLNPKTGRPEPLQLFRHLIANPGNVPGFNRLLKNAKTAQIQLARGLDDLLPQLLRLV